MFRHFALFLCLGFACSGLRAQEGSTPKEPADQPTVPGPRFEKKTWSDAHQANTGRAKQGDIDLVFFGDSLTARWNLYPELIKAKFGSYKTAFMGIGGDQTQDLLWRLQNGELENFQPRLVVLLIGANNMALKLKYTPEEIARGAAANIAEIHQRAPRAKILLVSIFTRNVPMDDWLNIKNADTNKLLAKMADGSDVIYVDLWKLFLKPDGNVDETLYADMTHLNEKGFARYADALLPLIGKELAP